MLAFLSSISMLLLVFLSIPLLSVYYFRQKRAFLSNSLVSKDYNPQEANHVLLAIGIVLLYGFFIYFLNTFIVVGGFWVFILGILMILCIPIMAETDDTFIISLCLLEIFTVITATILFTLQVNGFSFKVNGLHLALTIVTLGSAIFLIGIDEISSYFQKKLQKKEVNDREEKREKNLELAKEVLLALMPKELSELLSNENFTDYVADDFVYYDEKLLVKTESDGFKIESWVGVVKTTFDFTSLEKVKIAAQSGDISQHYYLSYEEVKEQDYSFLTEHLKKLLLVVKEKYQEFLQKETNEKNELDKHESIKKTLDLSLILNQQKEMVKKAKMLEVMEYIKENGDESLVKELMETVSRKIEMEKEG